MINILNKVKTAIPNGTSTKIEGSTPKKISSGVANFALTEPVIAKTINITTNWLLDLISHLFLRRFITGF